MTRVVGLVDSMAHLDDPRVTDPAALLRRSRDAGVEAIITAGVDPLIIPEQRWRDEDLLGISIRRAYGLHPQAINRQNVTAQLDRLGELLGGEAVVAVGEIGLDNRDTMPPAGLQEVVLRTQLQLARQLELPVILHCVHATGRLIEILGELEPLPAGGLLHGFGGPAELVDAFVGLGLHLSIGGLVCNEAAKRCRKAAAVIPKDRLLVESDTPDHAPDRADYSEPASITQTLATLAALRGTTAAELGTATAHNARRVYRLG